MALSIIALAGILRSSELKIRTFFCGSSAKAVEEKSKPRSTPPKTHWSNLSRSDADRLSIGPIFGLPLGCVPERSPRTPGKTCAAEAPRKSLQCPTNAPNTWGDYARDCYEVLLRLTDDLREPGRPSCEAQRREGPSDSTLARFSRQYVREVGGGLFSTLCAWSALSASPAVNLFFSTYLPQRHRGRGDCAEKEPNVERCCTAA